MKIEIAMTGSTPLLLHNAQLVDPDNEFSKAISAITSKGAKKTEDDRIAIGRNEWFGSLYIENGGGLVLPTAMLRKSIINAAKVHKLGKAVERSLHFHSPSTPLLYEGSDDLEALWVKPGFRYKTHVRVGSSRVMRTRPRFFPWIVVAEAELITEVLDFEALESATSQAGMIEGLGDGRSVGFGRYVGVAKEIA